MLAKNFEHIIKLQFMLFVGLSNNYSRLKVTENRTRSCCWNLLTWHLRRHFLSSEFCCPFRQLRDETLTKEDADLPENASCRCLLESLELTLAVTVGATAPGSYSNDRWRWCHPVFPESQDASQYLENRSWICYNFLKWNTKLLPVG